MIGIALEVDSATLDGLQQSSISDDLKLASVIETWIKTEPSPVTWQTLIDGIDGPLLNQKKKAKEIRDYLGLCH